MVTLFISLVFAIPAAVLLDGHFDDLRIALLPFTACLLSLPLTALSHHLQKMDFERICGFWMRARVWAGHRSCASASQSIAAACAMFME